MVFRLGNPRYILSLNITRYWDMTMQFHLANFCMDIYVTLLYGYVRISVLSQENLEIHRAGFKSVSMHNLSDLVQQAVATNVCLNSSSFTLLLGKIRIL